MVFQKTIESKRRRKRKSTQKIRNADSGSDKDKENTKKLDKQTKKEEEVTTNTY